MCTGAARVCCQPVRIVGDLVLSDDVALYAFPEAWACLRRQATRMMKLAHFVGLITLLHSIQTSRTANSA